MTAVVDIHVKYTKFGTSLWQLSILVTENEFRGARWLVVVVVAIRVIPGGTGRLMVSSNSHAMAVSVAF